MKDVAAALLELFLLVSSAPASGICSFLICCAAAFLLCRYLRLSKGGGK